MLTPTNNLLLMHHMKNCSSTFILFPEGHLKYIFSDLTKIFNNIKISNINNENINPNSGVTNTYTVTVRYLKISRLKIFDKIIDNIYITNL